MNEIRRQSLRVVIVGLRPPRLPLRDGYALHLYHLLRELSIKHDVHFVAPHDGLEAFEDIPGLTSHLMSPGLHDLAKELQPLIRDLNPQVAHLVGAQTSRFIGGLSNDLPVVLGALDAPHINIEAATANGLPAKARKLIKRRMAMRSVKRRYGNADRVVVVSDEDAQILRQLNPGLSITAIPNGVDIAAFAHQPAVERHPDRLLFTGALGYPPNVDAALFLVNSIFPHIRAAHPATRLALVGRDPADSVTALDNLVGVEVVGPVEDMAESLSGATIYLCPMISGTGIKNKLLEAMANGLPCVATPLAVRGMKIRPGVDVLIESAGERFAEATIRLLEDEGLRQRIGQAGFEYVSRSHTWSAMADRYESIYLELINA